MNGKSGGIKVPKHLIDEIVKLVSQNKYYLQRTVTIDLYTGEIIEDQTQRVHYGR